MDQRERVVYRLSAAGVDPLEATEAELEEWAMSLVSRLTAESRATEVSHVRGWFRWLYETGRRDSDVSAHLVRYPQGDDGVPAA